MLALKEFAYTIMVAAVWTAFETIKAAVQITPGFIGVRMLVYNEDMVTGMFVLKDLLWDNDYGHFCLKLWLYSLMLYYIDKVYTRRNFPAQRA
jgi:hypothetical protein